MTAKPNGLKAYSPEEAAAILNAAMHQSPGTAYAALQQALTTRIDAIEEVLPDQMRGQGARLIKRAMITFSKSEKLQECTAASFVRCVLEGAEVGLAIDGKLGHAVPYNNKIKVNGREVWQKEAQFQPDYKGLIAIAKRVGQIRDAYGDVVRANDHFKHGRIGGESILEHSYGLADDRGEVIGAYAVIKTATDWRAEVMSLPDLDRIRNKSKAKDSGPWATDTDQMRIKTVIKRGLKLYCDDPGLIRALELDDREYEGDAAAHQQSRVRRSALNDVLAAQPVNRIAAHEHAPEGTQEQAHDEADQREPGDDTDLDAQIALEESARELGCPEDQLQAVCRVASSEPSPAGYLKRKPWEKASSKAKGQLFDRSPSAQEA